MSITHLTSLSQLDSILAKSKEKVSVIDFHAQWCGPCHAIAPTFEALAKRYPNVNFLKCDVEAVRDVAGKFTVTAMPTFIFLRGSTKVDQVRGANRSALEDAVRRHASNSSSSSFSGKGQTLGGSPAPPDIVGDVQGVAGSVASGWNSIDPQMRVFLVLGGLYALFWFYS